MTDILQEIATYKHEFVARRRIDAPLEEVSAKAQDLPAPLDFAGALQADPIALIAEVKKASPSKGVIREDFDPESIARIYAENGARALSVLTDEAYFQGCDDYLTSARQAAGIPALRKDFNVDSYQIHEARLLGADAILLIVALMDGGQLEDFQGLGRDLGLSVLVEVHSREELERALGAGASLIGINNRDLRTFDTTLETTFELRQFVPEGVTLVSESGIRDHDDVRQLSEAGIDAILVGESLMRAEDIGVAVQQLLG
ncbi:MAG: indole-3-glycerol phosphate synthase TrpC [Gemmatimonadetes bacterium]|nr:indole-3-glycerol phosphate synthase TrpC [Gemmatimonadota bacterium]MBT4612289.1 indole-3-glycerol phosphate synthase TrpC [Gemmatimonadota bacterium]MBT5060674.1 indole-3-glycerol phosphate synthase TrpC [Gemmatimonadota bacterium]MBT5145416.1 indole-3-glycerol phosphate synthase TrpC [Gemmatimonadota bacterium]MBT5591604.1 indole-3-glycerol phosphate synthase TrpC [Gemmatimonadota bacterium]